MKLVTINLTSDASGDATGNSVASGIIKQIYIKDGSVAPTNLWDLTLTDDSGATLYTNTGVTSGTAVLHHPKKQSVSGTASVISDYSEYICANRINAVGANMGGTASVQVFVYVKED